VTSVLRRSGQSDFVRRDLRAAVVPWALARVLVVGSLGLARFLFDEVASGRRPVAMSQGLFAFDASWYRAIAEDGYAPLAREARRFFPLFPLLGRWLGTVMLDHPEVALLLIANGSALVFAALLHRLTLRETGDAALANRAAWYASVVPPAMALVLGYAESLAMCFAVGMFLLVRSGRWLPAVPLGVLAGLCRPVGVLLVVPMAIEALRGWSASALRAKAERAAVVVAPVVGMGAYLVWVGARFGDVFEPLTIQNRRGLRGGFVDPFTRVVDAVSDLFGGDRFGSGLHIVWVAVCVVLIVMLARRLPASYTAYAATAVVLALTARNLDSFERYAMSTFPLLIGVALVTARAPFDRVVSALAAGGLVGYSLLAFFGSYVP